MVLFTFKKERVLRVSTIVQEDKKLLALLKEGDEKAILKIYEFYREEFLSWGSKNYSLDSDESADIFQDTVIVLYFNIRQDKICDLTSSLKTYLFAIGKNLILKKLRKDKRMINVEDVQTFSSDLPVENPFEVTERQKYIAKIIDSLGEPCMSILKYFYFNNFSMEAIAQIMGYKNQHVVKTIKRRCMKTLKSKMDGEAF